jgi:hypothetical protein
MRSFMEAYQAVHNKEAKENLEKGRDSISEMNLSQLTDGDLCEIAEEVLEVMFADGNGVADCEAIVESILTSSTNPGRQAKIERLQESFKKVFGTVKEKSARTAVESYALYRKGKSLQDNWSRKFSHENGNVRLHNSLVAEDRAGVKNGLLELYKGKHGQEEYVDEAEKPFPYEKVKKKQVSLRDKGGNALDRRMQMGAAVRRAKEAEKSGGSQRDAGKGWYHAKEEYVDEADSIAAMRERAAKRRQQRYGKSGGGGRDDFRPYTKADYERGEKKTAKEEVEVSQIRKDWAEAYAEVYVAEKKGDGNLANNYPPYDKVTRGDIIAGATGKDQMGGKNIRGNDSKEQKARLEKKRGMKLDDHPQFKEELEATGKFTAQEIEAIINKL